MNLRREAAVPIAIAAALWALAPEMSSGQAPGPDRSHSNSPPTFTSRVELVLVRVVVRDSSGRAIGNLKQEDFQLFDRGKPQTISRFTVEKTAGGGAAAQQGSGTVTPQESAAAGKPAQPTATPERFTAYLFDDLHLDLAQLAQACEAARRQFPEALQDDGRAAILTTSGQNTVDFTDGIDKLRDALGELKPRGRLKTATKDCPDLSVYQADLIRYHDDQAALDEATSETIRCSQIDPRKRIAAQSSARAEAGRVAAEGVKETRLSLEILNYTVRRMAQMRGQRSIVLVSPGLLLMADLRSRESEIVDRALRANIVINTLDARGLTVNFDITNPYTREAAMANSDIMIDLAHGTGGMYVHNNNDLRAGLQRLATPPECAYILGFTPADLKPDGAFHALKVSLKESKGLSLQVRRGYYAPTETVDEAARVKEEIRDAFFSGYQIKDIPITLRTQFTRAAGLDAKLSLLAQVDVKGLPFRRADDRNNDTLTVVSGVFDRNGNVVASVEKRLDLHLTDESLAKLAPVGVTVTSTFEVKPGAYNVRVVVRDSEGQYIAAENGEVTIP